jgi:pimeloyl-ACP methyl ester carboxylesterase
MDIDSVPSRLAEVSGGDIEYARAGKGPSVLISHGTLGGYDQALAVARLFDREKFSFLAPSRAGYLRSSPGTGRSAGEQARSYVELLDQLEIDSAAVMGLSGGSPAAISFAEGYPDRCWSLVLISSAATALPPLPLFFRLSISLQKLPLNLDPVWATMYQNWLPLMMRSNGVNPDQIARIFEDPHLLEVVRGIYRPVTSLSERREGFLLDDVLMTSLPEERHYDIHAPTLVSHAANDPMAPASHAARMAQAIPGAEYLELPDGGHIFFVVHSERVVPEIERFLLAHAPPHLPSRA